jgi:hypothetical protein
VVNSGAQLAKAELEQEGQRLLAQKYIKCGDDYFTKFQPMVTVSMPKGPHSWAILQAKEVMVGTDLSKLADVDRLNGVEWKGRVEVQARLVRWYATAQLYPKWVPPQRQGWTDWEEHGPPGGSISAMVEKRNGTLTVKTLPGDVLSVPTCDELPPP